MLNSLLQILVSDPMKGTSIAEVRGFPEAGLGTLYVVATPIGNLEDITLRALRILHSVDRIACEDTRQTRKLLSRFQIHTEMTSYHEHNELTKASELVRDMEEGARIALVSDAGMPCVSDPGFRLVHLCIRHKIPVVPIPGPSAVVAALAASGLAPHAFQFVGFLPPKKNSRRKFLQSIEAAASTTVCFESPRRLRDTLQDIQDVLGDRHLVVAREITKIHEEFLRGRCSEILESLRKREEILGEITVLIAPASEEPSSAVGAPPLPERVAQLMKQKKLSRMEALKVVARERRISKSQAYREYVAASSRK